MARELKRWKKAAMARAAAAAPVEQAQAPKVILSTLHEPKAYAATQAQPSKKKVMTKEEKRNLIDLEKIKKKRASAQQGIKSKYTKRNVSIFFLHIRLLLLSHSTEEDPASQEMFLVWYQGYSRMA